MDDDYLFRQILELIRKQTKFITHCGPIMMNIFLNPQIIPAVVCNEIIDKKINQQQMQQTINKQTNITNQICQVREKRDDSNQVKIVSTVGQFYNGEQQEQKLIEVQEQKKEPTTIQEKNLLKKKKKYSGYHIYMLEQTKELQNLNFVAKYKKIGQNWKEMTNEQKQVYKLQAQKMNLQIKQETQQSSITVKKSERNRKKLETLSSNH